MIALLFFIAFALILRTYIKINHLSDRIQLLENKSSDRTESEATTLDDEAVTFKQEASVPEESYKFEPTPITFNHYIPSWCHDVYNKIKNRLRSINSITLLGGFLLFLGVAFLLNYMANSNLLSLNFRLLSTATIAGLVLFFGLRLRKSKRNYSLSLQGIAIAIWYLLTVSSCYHFHVISFHLGFILLALLSILCCVIALIQDSDVLIISGITGGFFSALIIPAPFMGGFYFLTFYWLLNLIIFTISWFKSWRGLNLIGFIFTFLLSLFWCHLYYQPDIFMITEVYLVLFYLLYLIIPVIYAYKQPPNLKGYVDSKRHTNYTLDK